MTTTKRLAWFGRPRMVAGLALAAALCVGVPAAFGQSNNQPEKPKSDPGFVPPPPQARTLPSILEFDADGKVVWIEDDPARRAASKLRMSESDRKLVEELFAERDAALLAASIPFVDKVVDAMSAKARGDMAALDDHANRFYEVAGLPHMRAAFTNEPTIRQRLRRSLVADITDVVRPYNLARADEERAAMLAAAGGEELPELMLRDSMILQRFWTRDIVALASRLLEERLGGVEALAGFEPGVAERARAGGFWPALASLTHEQLEDFVTERTDRVVKFPSPSAAELRALRREPDGGRASAPPSNNQRQAAGPRRMTEIPMNYMPPPGEREPVVFAYSDAQLEALRVQPGDGPTLVRRGPDGLAIRLARTSHLEAYDLMLSAGLVSDDEADRLDEVLADRQRVFDEQVLRLYEFVTRAASFGPVESGDVADAVLSGDWLQWSFMFGAWLNERLPAPATFHNDPRVREALTWDTLVELARIANEYDGAHIFDARIELLRRVRDDDRLDDPNIAMPANIKNPWRLMGLMRDAKASYARQLRVTEPDFRGVLASLELDEQTTRLIADALALDGPMTPEEFWHVSARLPAWAHRQLVRIRTGYEAPEPGSFDDLSPNPTGVAGGN